MRTLEALLGQTEIDPIDGARAADRLADLFAGLGDLVAITCEAAVPGASAVVLGSRVYAVVPDAAGLRAHAIVPQLLERVKGSLRRPVLIGVGGHFGNVLRVQPPLVIEEAALETALDVLDAALASVTRAVA